MAVILQMASSNTFSSMEIDVLLIQISLKIVPKDPIYNISTLV